MKCFFLIVNANWLKNAPHAALDLVKILMMGFVTVVIKKLGAMYYRKNMKSVFDEKTLVNPQKSMYNITIFGI